MSAGAAVFVVDVGDGKAIRSELFKQPDGTGHVSLQLLNVAGDVVPFVEIKPERLHLLISALTTFEMEFNSERGEKGGAR